MDVPGGRTYQPWGMLAAIDLHGCERSRLEDPGTLRRFVPSLISAIGMRAHGPLMLDRFGDGTLEVPILRNIASDYSRFRRSVCEESFRQRCEKFCAPGGERQLRSRLSKLPSELFSDA